MYVYLLGYRYQLKTKLQITLCTNHKIQPDYFDIFPSTIFKTIQVKVLNSKVFTYYCYKLVECNRVSYKKKRNLKF